MQELRQDLLNPTVAKMLRTFHLDKNYVSGQGSYLFDEKGNRYLDFIAQYGAVPFGYNPPVIWEALERVRSQQIPSLVQPSLPGEALRLANKLAQITPGDLCYCTFCQSGTEAVEAAIKLARSATGKLTIVSTERSFHGKTLELYQPLAEMFIKHLSVHRYLVSLEFPTMMPLHWLKFWKTIPMWPLS